jgi:hypothetical protein
VKNPAAGGGRWVDVAPERFATWVHEFGQRHGGAGPATHDDGAATVTFSASDGSIADCHPPVPPLPALPPDPATWPETIAAHAAAPRTVGVLLVRLGGYAIGVFAGAPPELVSSKAGSRPVHGRSSAGGWSQHRFARRREKQVSEAISATADHALAILKPAAPEAIVLGGDRRAVAALREDPRLAPYLDRAADRFLTVPDPRLAVLRETPRAFQSIRIRLVETSAR